MSDKSIDSEETSLETAESALVQKNSCRNAITGPSCVGHFYSAVYRSIAANLAGLGIEPFRMLARATMQKLISFVPLWFCRSGSWRLAVCSRSGRSLVLSFSVARGVPGLFLHKLCTVAPKNVWSFLWHSWGPTIWTQRIFWESFHLGDEHEDQDSTMGIQRLQRYTNVHILCTILYIYSKAIKNMYNYLQIYMSYLYDILNLSVYT